MAGYLVSLSRWFYQGEVSSGAKVYVYQHSTTTPVTIYTDAALTTPAPNPFICDSNGEAAFYVGSSVALRFYVTTSGDVLIRDINPVYPVPNLAGFTGTGADLAYLAGVTPGTIAANKAVVVDSNKDAAAFRRISNSEGVIGAYSSFKNRIIGGDFSTNPWQRQTSFAAAVDGTYAADRWRYNKSGTMVHTISKSTDAPSVASAGRYISHSLLANLTTPLASVGSTEFCAIVQRIEGYNFQALAQKSFTLSFWVKATTTGTYCVAFRNSGADRTYIAEYNVTTTDTWQFKTITVTASPTAGTWDYANGVGLDVIFTLAAGTTFRASAGSWQTGNFYATANQVNGVDTGATNFRLALVQIEPGAAATVFEPRSIQQELALCQRYFFKSYPQGTYAGASVGNDAAGSTQYYFTGVTNTTHTIRHTIPFPVTMRAAPAVTWYSTDGTAAKARDRAASANIDASSVSASDRSVALLTTTGSTTDPHIEVYLTATAEL